MNDLDLSCREDQRREHVRADNLFGLDYVDVSDDQLTLNVFFLGKAPHKFEKGNLVISGGRRIRDVQIKDIRVQRQPDPTLDDSLEVLLTRSGDFSTYTLSAVDADALGNPTTTPMQGFDAFYSRVEFTFKAGCPSDLDCRTRHTCPPPRREQPEINYLAKDYRSFRQLLLDRLALIMPAWTETHAPDIGITLVELLAYAGDYLSYYQDAVATEAYLGTARERISIRRHARLVDYRMHEGCNSRTWLILAVEGELQLDPAQIFFVTAYPNAPDGPVLSLDDLRNVPTAAYDVFETLQEDPATPISLHEVHNEIHFYTWGDCQCCLAPGATSATLIDWWIVPQQPPPGGVPSAAPGGSGSAPANPQTPPASGQPGVVARAVSAGTPASQQSSHNAVALKSEGPPGALRALRLRAGDVLIFEEVLGPKTGNLADADPTHRQAVRLTRVTPAIDPLYHPYGPDFGQPIVEIEWDAVDALTFPLCISSQAPAPACNCKENVSVARGNVILVDAGGDTVGVLGAVPTQSGNLKCPACCEPSEIEILPGLYRPTLTQQPLTMSQPLPPPCSARDLLVQDPRQALPAISLASIPPGPVALPRPPKPGLAPPPLCAAPLFAFSDLDDPATLAAKLLHPSDPASEFLLSRLSAATRLLLLSWNGSDPLPFPLRDALISNLAGLLETWLPQLDLLESGPEDRSFVVEIDNNGFGHLRFGDGVLGRRPDAGTAFRASCRVGNGASGNVGRETIAYIVFRGQKQSGVTLVRNPFPAVGGMDPEPIEDVKQFAPYAFRDQLERAITADDYGAIAGDNDRRLSVRSTLEISLPELCGTPFVKLQEAKATLRWAGSWYTMLVALDPEGSEDTDQDLIDEITAYLVPFRRMGYDLFVRPAEYVPLTVRLTVCVLPNYLRAHVEAAVLDTLSNRALPDGTLGFFHPDNLSFGEGIYASRLIAVVQSVPGVQSVQLTELERFEISEPPAAIDQPGEELPPHSLLALGPLEVARLDNDPNFPENGRLYLDLRGGR